MIEFCFETINWSPYFGVDEPDVVRLVQAAAAAGFEWISFDETILDAHCRGGDTLPGLRRVVDSEGLRVLAIHSIALADDPRAASEACRPLAEAAATLAAPWIQVGGTAPLGEKLFESTRAAAEVASEAGAGLAVEFLPFLEIDSIARTRALLESASLEAAGIVVDSWHFFHGPDDWPDLASLSSDEIAYLQFDDHPPLIGEDLLEETTQRRVYPGQGEFDLDRFARTLRGVGFDGVVGLELLSAEHRERPVEQVARELLEASRRYW